MARWRALAVLALVATAGCTGLPGQPGGDAGTVTPAPVPDPDRPPGVSLDPASIDPGVVAERHAALLTNRSVTVRKVTTLRTADGRRLAERDWTVQYAPGRQFFADMTASGELAAYPWGNRSAYWANDSRAAVLRSVYGDVEVRGGRPRNVIPPFERTLRGRLAVLFSGVTVERVARLEGTDPASYRLVAIPSGDPSDLVLTGSTGRVSNLTLTARIDERGVVRGYTLAYTEHREGRSPERTEVAVRVRVRDVGSTTVERPPWVDDAVAATDWTEVDPECTNVHSPHPPSC